MPNLINLGQVSKAVSKCKENLEVKIHPKKQKEVLDDLMVKKKKEISWSCAYQGVKNDSFSENFA